MLVKSFIVTMLKLVTFMFSWISIKLCMLGSCCGVICSARPSVEGGAEPGAQGLAPDPDLLFVWPNNNNNKKTNKSKNNHLESNGKDNNDMNSISNDNDNDNNNNSHSNTNSCGNNTTLYS